MGIEFEIQTSTVIQEFDAIYASELEADKWRVNEPTLDYAYFRALKETLRSTQFVKANIGNNGFRELSVYILDHEILGWNFREWIRTREFDWERKTLPRNAYRLYALGKQEILKREGKK